MPGNRFPCFVDYVDEDEKSYVTEQLKTLNNKIQKIINSIETSEIEQFNNTKPTLAIKYGEHYIQYIYEDIDTKSTQWYISGDLMHVELTFPSVNLHSYAWAITIYMADDLYLHVSNCNGHPYVNINCDSTYGIDFCNSDGSTHIRPDSQPDGTYSLLSIIEFANKYAKEFMLQPSH